MKTKAEVDAEVLREAMEWIESFQGSIDPIVEQWSRAIIVALEDRDRLRAERDAWRQIAKARQVLLARDEPEAVRSRARDDITKARIRLSELRIDEEREAAALEGNNG